MTDKETREAIKSLPGMTGRKTDGEWRVTINIYRLSERFPTDNIDQCDERQEAMAYYTTDAEDALSTARAMSATWEAGK